MGRFFEIKRFAVHDGDGIRTTVFLKGCPLKCVWCHNPEGLDGKPQLAFYPHKCVECGECADICPNGAHKVDSEGHAFLRESCDGCGMCADLCPRDSLKFYGRQVTADRLLPVLIEDKEFYENSGGGVTFSGGECLLQADFVRECLIALKKEGINTAVDTCGFVSREQLDKVIPYTDTFLYDIKAISPDVHKKCTGQTNEIILDNLLYLDKLKKDIEIRIPYVPDYNDTEMEEIAHFLSGLTSVKKVRVLPYHNYAGSKYASLGMEITLPKNLPTPEQIQSATALIKNITGLNVV